MSSVEIGPKDAVMPPTHARAKILVVDDEPMNLLAFGAALESLDKEIVKVDSGEQALRRLLDEDFAVVILDVQMPGMDGFETADLIRRRRRCETTPIIFLTAINQQMTHVRRGYALGAVDYLFKPVDPEILRAKVGVFIDLFEQRQRLLAQADQIHALERARMLDQERTAHAAELHTTERQAKLALERKAAELARSNAELEQFAYVASHDLREPLRMVSSFTQLLAEDYGDSLDDTAREYIQFAVDGAKRMEALILDLLALSRVGSDAVPFRVVRTQDAVNEAVRLLAPDIKSTGANMEVGELPEVAGDPTQIVQVFQNLLANALKFRGEDPPRVRISARREEKDWIFSVRDNGIGIAPEFHERVFQMFQRLHPRDVHVGSGMGLAIVKKIVERHGGSVWLASTPGDGSTFSFSLPAELEAPPRTG